MKRSSAAIEMAERRLAAMQSIGEDLDLGNGFTLDTFINAIEDAQEKLNAYNTQLSMTDAAASHLEEAEKLLKAFSAQMLRGVALKYGDDSIEYEKAGGTRKSDRKRPARKSQPAV
jgi:chromosome condensin MukBEF ATPase and DNA-binding subunit MukB